MDNSSVKKSYGLVLKGKPKLGHGPPKSLDQLVEEKSRQKKVQQVFVGESSDEETNRNTVEKTKKGSATEVRNKKLVQMQHEKALAEDPSVFSYDDIYDEMAAKRNEKVESQKTADKERKPKYVPQLLKAAEKRQKDQIARDDRKQQKERELEGEKFKDDEVFVTGAYRKQMEEMEKYKEEEARKEAFEARMDVTKQRDLTGFYKHLLNDSLAREGTSQESKTDIKTEPEESHSKPEGAEREKSVEKSSSKAKATEKPEKRKMYRRKRSSESSESEPESGQHLHQNSAKEHKKSIYSDSESSENDGEHRKGTESQRKGGLETVAKKSRDEAKRAETKAERTKRFYTPTPPSSPEVGRKEDRSKLEKKERKRKRSSSDDRRKLGKKSAEEKSEKKSRRKKDADKMSPDSKKDKDASSKQEEKPGEAEKKDPVKERMERLREIFARRNHEAAVDAYRRRYFERKAADPMSLDSSLWRRGTIQNHLAESSSDCCDPSSCSAINAWCKQLLTAHH